MSRLSVFLPNVLAAAMPATKPRKVHMPGAVKKCLTPALAVGTSCLRPPLVTFVASGQRWHYLELKRKLRKMEKEDIPNIDAYITAREQFSLIELNAISQKFGIPAWPTFPETIRQSTKTWCNRLQGLDMSTDDGEPAALFFQLWRSTMCEQETYQQLHSAITSLLKYPKHMNCYSSFLQDVIKIQHVRAVRGGKYEMEQALIHYRGLSFLRKIEPARAQSIDPRDSRADFGVWDTARVSKAVKQPWRWWAALKYLEWAEYKYPPNMCTRLREKSSRAAENNHALALTFTIPRVNMLLDADGNAHLILQFGILFSADVRTTHVYIDGNWIETKLPDDEDNSEFAEELKDPAYDGRVIDFRPRFAFNERVRLRDFLEYDEKYKWWIGSCTAPKPQHVSAPVYVPQRSFSPIHEPGLATDEGEIDGEEIEFSINEINGGLDAANETRSSTLVARHSSDVDSDEIGREGVRMVWAANRVQDADEGGRYDMRPTELREPGIAVDEGSMSDESLDA
jgi:hypothetical protein